MSYNLPERIDQEIIAARQTPSAKACASPGIALLLARPQRLNKATEPGRQTAGPKKPTAADQALLPC